MKKETIVANTMREFKEGKLRSSNGDKVTDRDQAIAIALSKSGQSKFDEGGSVEDIADAITGAKTLLKFASASDKKEIETFIKGLEILKKMSSEPKTQQADKKKPLAPDSKTKKEEFVSTPIKEGQIYFDAPKAKPAHYNLRIIKSISGKSAIVQIADVFNGETRTYGQPYSESVEYIQNIVDKSDKEKFDKAKKQKELIESILKQIEFDNFKGGDLNSLSVQKSLAQELYNLKIYANKTFSTSDRTQGAGYYGSTKMYSSSRGEAISLSFNNIYRGGYYEGSRPYFVSIQIGGALPIESLQALKQAAIKILEKYTYESEYGMSKVLDYSGTSYSSVLLTSPEKNNQYQIIPYFNSNWQAEFLAKTKPAPEAKSVKKPSPKKKTPDKDSLKEAKVYFQQEFDTTPEEDDLIKALINSDKSKFRTEKEIEAEKYFSETKFEDEFDNHIKTLIEYSKKKPSKNSKSKYTLDEAKKFFIEAGKIDEVSPDTERLIRALIDQDKSPIRTEDELYAEKSLLPNITNWSEDWKYHITNLISLSKNKKGEFPKSEKRYTYALTIRPFDIGTYPKENFVRFVYEEEEDYKFGLLEYSEPIPDRDLKHYSLAPVSELNQYNEKLFDYFDGNIGQAFIKKTPGNIPYVKVDLYDDPNEEAIETIDLSGQEFLSKIKSGDYKILENQSKLKDTDGENNLKKKQSLENIKKQIIDFVEKNSWFELDDDSDDFMLFATRENGNIGSESPGSKDIAEAKRLKAEIEKKFKDLVKIELEVVDEWVHINIDILRNKFASGGVIGQEIVFDDNGEANKGVIKDIHEITGDYIVATEDGRTVLASKELDVISLGAMRKKPLEAARKRFGFFKDGGLIDYKKKQLDIINRTNPAPNNINTWIRSVDDIKTAEEVFSVAFEEGAMYPDFQIEDMQEALDTGFVTIYSSYPIKPGVFVTPSAMNATDYAGGNRNKIHSKKVKLNEVAWIDESEGQYAPVNKFESGGATEKSETILWAVKIGEPDWKEQIITTDPNLIEPAKKWAMANGFDRFRIVGIDMSSKPDFTKTFAKGGLTSPNYEIVEGYDHYKNIPLYRVTDRDEYVGEWHTDLRVAENELSELNDTRIFVYSDMDSETGIIAEIQNKKFNSLESAKQYAKSKGYPIEVVEMNYSRFKDGGNVRDMDWYQMWQSKRNKVVKVGDIVVHQHSKQPYKIIELLDDQYTVAKLDGNKEIEWKTFYEDFEDHKMFMPQQFAGGGTTLSQYIWNNHDLMIKGRYKVTGAVEAEVVVAGWEVGGDGKDEYLSMYQPSMEQNPEIKTLIVKRPNLRKMSNGVVVPATTGTGKKVKIQRIGGIYLKNDGQPY